MLHVDPMAVHDMCTLGLWDMAYGPAFFDFGREVPPLTTHHPTISLYIVPSGFRVLAERCLVVCYINLWKILDQCNHRCL